ncbi:MAG: hypothetical protein WEB58_16050 [Planctomycetaceae bacterium]
MKHRIMKTQICSALAFLCAVAVVANSASAQAPRRPRNFGRPSTPPISPNLMLLNRGNSFEYNYLSNLGMNRRMNQMSQEYSMELDTLERDFYQNRSQAPQSTIGPQGTSVTGHSTGFFNYGNYYRMGRR